MLEEEEGAIEDEEITLLLTLEDDCSEELLERLADGIYRLEGRETKLLIPDIDIIGVTLLNFPEMPGLSKAPRTS